MPFTYYTNPPSEIEKAVHTTRAVGLSGVTLDAMPPGSKDIDAGTVSAERAVATDFFISLDIQTTRAIALVGVTLDTSAQETKDINAGTVALQRAVAKTATVSLDIITQRTIGLTGVTLNTSGSGAKDIDAGAVSASRSASVTTSVDIPDVERSVQTTRSVDLTGVTLNTTTPPSGQDIDAGTVTLQRQHARAYEVTGPYSHDFHSGGVSVSASACTGVECETNTTAPSETDSTASGAQGAALTVTIPVGTMTLNATGTVTVEELGSGGSVLDTHSESWGTAAEGQTLTMDFTGDPNVQQLRVEAELTADSQNASGGGSCSSDADCTDETAQIASAITISE